MDNYIELTSFTHKPYYQKFSPEVPDNWENEQMYNLPLDEMMEVADYALTHGYTVCGTVMSVKKVFHSKMVCHQSGSEKSGRPLGFRPCTF